MKFYKHDVFSLSDAAEYLNIIISENYGNPYKNTHAKTLKQNMLNELTERKFIDIFLLKNGSHIKIFLRSG